MDVRPNKVMEENKMQKINRICCYCRMDIEIKEFESSSDGKAENMKDRLYICENCNKDMVLSLDTSLSRN